MRQDFRRRHAVQDAHVLAGRHGHQRPEAAEHRAGVGVGEGLLLEPPHAEPQRRNGGRARPHHAPCLGPLLELGLDRDESVDGVGGHGELGEGRRRRLERVASGQVGSHGPVGRRRSPGGVPSHEPIDVGVCLASERFDGDVPLGHHLAASEQERGLTPGLELRQVRGGELVEGRGLRRGDRRRLRAGIGANGQEWIARGCGDGRHERVAGAHVARQHGGRRHDAERVAQPHPHALESAEHQGVRLGVGRGRDGNQVAGEFEADRETGGHRLAFDVRRGGVARGQSLAGLGDGGGGGAVEGRAVVGGIGTATDDAPIKPQDDCGGDQAALSLAGVGERDRVERSHGVAKGREEPDGVLGLRGGRDGTGRGGLHRAGIDDRDVAQDQHRRDKATGDVAPTRPGRRSGACLGADGGLGAAVRPAGGRCRRVARGLYLSRCI